MAIDFPFIVKTKVFEMRSRAVDLFGYISQKHSISGVCAPDVGENKVELSRNPRSRFFFLAVLSSSLFVGHMFSQIHLSATSIKAFYLSLLLDCDCLHLEAVSFKCLLFTEHSS